jgi:molybdenum cofactor cytidylyltransferase
MITAIILAAGESKRMGQPKMLLPWGEETVISHVISVFRSAGVDDVLVVTGGTREGVEHAISHHKVRAVYNKDFANGEMLSSIQCGIRALSNQAQAVLIGLGDQPQVQERSVRLICRKFIDSTASIVVPSYNMRRGHPWLITRPLWDDLLNLESPHTPRDFLNAHPDIIQYVNMNNPDVLADLDTPEEYQKWQPNFRDKLSR